MAARRFLAIPAVREPHAAVPKDEWTGRAEIFEHSYDEVTALKHQDDKLNRTLTALAFLTAAGIALFALGHQDGN